MYKSLIEGKKAVLFDLDGTLVDSNPYWAVAFEKVLDEINPALDADDLFGGYGESLRQKWARLVKDGVLESNIDAAELVNKTHTEFLKVLEKYDLEPMEGFILLAAEMKLKFNLTLGLTTNTNKDIAEKILEKLKIDHVFDYLIFGDEVKNRKPDPEMYRITAKNLNFSPKEILVFEDSVVGAQAAVNAGMDTVVIWDTVVEKREYPKEVKLFMPDFEGLLGNLDKTIEEVFKDLEEYTESKNPPQQTQTPPRLK